MKNRAMKVMALSMASLMAMSMAAFAGETEAESSYDFAGGTVYGIYKAGDQTWFIDEGDAAKAKVEADGGDFIYVDAKMSPEEYLKDIDNAIANNAYRQRHREQRGRHRHLHPGPDAVPGCC